MAILNFPADPQQDDQYTGSNGTTYIYDGVKWIGRASGTAGTNSIQNSGFVVQVDSDGDLVTPTFTIPNTAGTSGQVLKWPSSGSTLAWAADTSTTSRLVNGLKEAILNSDGSITLPTSSTVNWEDGTLTGPTLQMGNDPTVDQVVITGPTPTNTDASARRIIIQGQQGFGGENNNKGEGSDVLVWAGAGGDGGSIDPRGNGGNVELRGGVGGNGGYVRLDSGDAQAESGFGGLLDLSAGDAIVTGGVGGNVSIRAGNGTAAGGMVSILTTGQQWNFDTNGTLSSAGGSWTKTVNDNLLSGVTTKVVWTSSYDFISGVKLTIQVEANPIGINNWEVQVCEAIIAAKGFNPSTEPVMSVYGVTHTSAAPLMTFSVQRNPTSQLIEIVGTRAATANTTGNASLRIYSVETGTND
jgi:hypothetical protein